MFSNKKAFVIRFLKENNIYMHERIRPILKEGSYSFIGFIDNNIGWASTKEGYSFWLKIQCEFILYVINNDNLYKFYNKKDIKSYFSKIIGSGYFSSRADSYSKSSEYYRYVKEKYEKFLMLYNICEV